MCAFLLSNISARGPYSLSFNDFTLGHAARPLAPGIPPASSFVTGQPSMALRVLVVRFDAIGAGRD
ncbi:hypothetical protein KJE20_05480 [Pyrenophora tritici-repentis]|nr:hypothetical protein KJE20_05480 [Pyrenophora tritici-repentis]